ncbi:MAG: DUF2063 domain-containing protein [Pelagibacterales bacterium]|nr:DUF2063 domain-containing protein [Pelagibacterales bacterium]
MPKKIAEQNLLYLQREFTKHLIDRDEKDILKFLPYSKEESISRLNIYRNNVNGNFESVLSSTFEAVKTVVGEQCFKFLTTKYIKNYHSKSGNLDLYGEEFPILIRDNLAKHKLDYLEDLAKLEFLYHKSYFSKDAKNIFDLEKFKNLKPEKFYNLTFTIHPSCYFFSSNFSIYSIWKNNTKNKQKIVSGKKEKEFLLIDRSLDIPKITKLSHNQYLFLSLIAKKKKLYETYEAIYKKTNQDFDIGSFLNLFISSAILVDFTIN